jgi:hypothetical protein
MAGVINSLNFYYCPSCLGLSLFVYMCLFDSIFARAYFIVGLWAVV